MMVRQNKFRKIVMEKSLDVVNSADLAKKVSDVVVFGNPDTWMLLCKASSKEQGWMKSTKVMNVPTGVILQVSTQQGQSVAEAVTYVPGVVAVHENGTLQLVSRGLNISA